MADEGRLWQGDHGSFVSSASMMKVHCAESWLQQQLKRTLIKKERISVLCRAVILPKHSKTTDLTENGGKMLHAKIVLNVYGYTIINKEL